MQQSSMPWLVVLTYRAWMTVPAVQEEKGDWLIYVVDAGQSQHFQMLFACARKAGILPTDAKQPPRIDFVPFGLVLGADRKRIKTREGKVHLSAWLHSILHFGSAHFRQPRVAEVKRQVPYLKQTALIRFSHWQLGMYIEQQAGNRR